MMEQIYFLTPTEYFRLLSVSGDRWADGVSHSLAGMVTQ
jgi:hypothetical protein